MKTLIDYAILGDFDQLQQQLQQLNAVTQDQKIIFYI